MKYNMEHGIYDFKSVNDRGAIVYVTPNEYISKLKISYDMLNIINGLFGYIITITFLMTGFEYPIISLSLYIIHTIILSITVSEVGIYTKYPCTKWNFDEAEEIARIRNKIKNDVSEIFFNNYSNIDKKTYYKMYPSEKHTIYEYESNIINTYYTFVGNGRYICDVKGNLGLIMAIIDILNIIF